MSEFDRFLEANEAFISGFTEGDLPLPPSRHVAVVACMDARLHPTSALGIALGESHIIRNAGGRITDDTIRSLVISQQLLETREIVVLHHTDCGMLSFTNDELVSIVNKELHQDVHNHDFLPFSNLEQSVIDDVNQLAKSPLILPGTPISGAIYDVKTGHVSEILRK
ncbi:beta-class carbonic anhydrase [Streptococcus loxodontisalivarius]|uniref:carbonic anhydrase n=1 Tax=Streptococcus loxodontisalivarius TaxID=1349415 RepID=A0ABS2PW66_9STRE|nr:carbonic anhydrase [Streptococcus loxodontisalivarius]MBM7643537.1 carbonic anhydrase [Streptococcus loxodontisalivarius]